MPMLCSPPRRLLTESEINQWFALYTNHDSSARMICDQAIAAIEYRDGLNKLIISVIEEENKNEQL